MCNECLKWRWRDEAEDCIDEYFSHELLCVISSYYCILHKKVYLKRVIWLLISIQYTCAVISNKICFVVFPTECLTYNICCKNWITRYKMNTAILGRTLNIALFVAQNMYVKRHWFNLRNIKPYTFVDNIFKTTNRIINVVNTC